MVILDLSKWIYGVYLRITETYLTETNSCFDVLVDKKYNNTNLIYLYHCIGAMVRI